MLFFFQFPLRISFVIRPIVSCRYTRSFAPVWCESVSAVGSHDWKIGGECSACSRRMYFIFGEYIRLYALSQCWQTKIVHILDAATAYATVGKFEVARRYYAYNIRRLSSSHIEPLAVPFSNQFFSHFYIKIVVVACIPRRQLIRRSIS